MRVGTSVLQSQRQLPVLPLQATVQHSQQTMSSAHLPQLDSLEHQPAEVYFSDRQLFPLAGVPLHICNLSQHVRCQPDLLPRQQLLLLHPCSADLRPSQPAVSAPCLSIRDDLEHHHLAMPLSSFDCLQLHYSRLRTHLCSQLHPQLHHQSMRTNLLAQHGG